MIKKIKEIWLDANKSHYIHTLKLADVLLFSKVSFCHIIHPNIHSRWSVINVISTNFQALSFDTNIKPKSAVFLGSYLQKNYYIYYQIIFKLFLNYYYTAHQCHVLTVKQICCRI